MSLRQRGNIQSKGRLKFDFASVRHSIYDLSNPNSQPKRANMHLDGSRQIAVLAYGSLLAHPGDWLGSRMSNLIRHDTPFPVEYAGRSFRRRGGAPTLVRCAAGGIVRGGLIVLPLNNTEPNVICVRDKLAFREGAAKGSSSKIKEEDIAGFHVLYADFDAAVEPQALQASTLATYAIASVEQCVSNGCSSQNGIRYLLENMEWGSSLL